MTNNQFENVTLRYWHGGKFQVVKNGELVYLGGQGRTFQVNPDEMCFWGVHELACKSGNYSEVDKVYYKLDGKTLMEGLRCVENDAGVFEMGQLAIKNRSLDVYVKHVGMPSPTKLKVTSNSPPPNRTQKLTPRRGPKTDVPTRSSPRLNCVIGPIEPPAIEKTSSSKSQTATKSKQPLFVDTSATDSNLKKTQNTSIETDVGKQAAPTNPIHKAKGKEKTISSTAQKQPIEDDFLKNYEWIDPGPESPLRYSDLISQSSEDEDDPLYIAEKNLVGDNSGASDDEFDDELTEEELDADDDEVEDLAGDQGLVGESDNSDEEFAQARERVRTCTSNLLHIAQQLQKEAAEGNLNTQTPPVRDPPRVDVGTGYESEYYDSQDDCETPPDSGDENEGGRRSRRGMLVGPETDFTKFEWKVGQRFTTRDDFKNAVAKYAIMQGRNVIVTISNKARRQEVGVTCDKSCPFYLYASWHSHKATFMVRKVVGVHHCHRNMKKNRQLKTTWVAREMLEVFKARPHWPAKDIIETVKRAYKVLVTKTFAYKVKYAAHKMLHGSMQDHYLKVGRYMAALKSSSPGTVVELVTDGSKQANPPVFQRLFCCFEGLQKGWREGCRKVICVDAAFLKTFLGGQIIAAVGRDANEQMFPIAWAAVEGENNLSWEWFFLHLQTCLQLGDGTGIAIISDEHQVLISS